MFPGGGAFGGVEEGRSAARTAEASKTQSTAALSTLAQKEDKRIKRNSLANRHAIAASDDLRRRRRSPFGKTKRRGAARRSVRGASANGGRFKLRRFGSYCVNPGDGASPTPCENRGRPDRRKKGAADRPPSPHWRLATPLAPPKSLIHFINLLSLTSSQSCVDPTMRRHPLEA